MEKHRHGYSGACGSRHEPAPDQRQERIASLNVSSYSERVVLHRPNERWTCTVSYPQPPPRTKRFPECRPFMHCGFEPLSNHMRRHVNVHVEAVDGHTTVPTLAVRVMMGKLKWT